MESERATVAERWALASAEAPMRIPRAADLVAARLRRSVVTGELREGDLLPPEAQLIASFGVGRPALREALRMLESEGLLRVRRGWRGGAVVTAPSRSVTIRAAGLYLAFNDVTLADVFETRTMLYRAAIGRLGRRGGRRARAPLAELAREQAARLDDPDAWWELEVQSPNLLLQAARLQTLELLGGLLSEISTMHYARRFHEMDAATRRDRIRRTTRFRLRYLELLEAGAGEEAEAFLESKAERAGELIFAVDGPETIRGFFEGCTPQLSHEKLAESVAMQLRHDIVHGRLQQGELLPPEPQLAARLGVGRPALREALRILESESLVTVERGSRGGGRIHAPSTSTAARSAGTLLQLGGTLIDDVYETRALLESAAARRLARRGLRRAQAALAQRATEPVAAFRAAVVELTGLRTLAFLTDVLNDIVARHRRTAPAAGDEPHDARASLVKDRHARLVRLVQAGDAADAELHWRRHVLDVDHWLDPDHRGRALDVIPP